MPSIDILFNISSKMAPFIQAMIDSDEYEEKDECEVIGIYQLPSDYIKYIDRTKCDIFYFVKAACTADERFEILKKYDTLKDYTFYKNNKENVEDCADIVNQIIII